MQQHCCDLCDFASNNKANLTRHLGTVKHKENLKVFNDNKKKIAREKIKCEFCKKTFSSRRNLSNHVKICNMKNLDCSIISTTEYLALQNKVKFLEEENKDFKAEKKAIISIAQTTATSGANSSSAMSTLVKNCNGAPPLREISHEKTVKILKHNDNDTFIDQILKDFRRKILVTKLVKLLVITYKRKNPKNQSFWASDTSRLTYIVKKLVRGKLKSKWVRDAQGKKVKELVISKVTQFIFEELIKYRENNHADPDAMENVVTALKLESDIEKGIIDNSILAKLAPHFSVADDLDNLDMSSDEENIDSGEDSDDDSDEDTDSDSDVSIITKRARKRK